MAHVVVRFGIVGLDAQGLLEVFDRLGRPALGKERAGPAVVSFGIVGFAAQGLLEVFGRLGRLALASKHHSPVGVGNG